jgi:DNA repair protein RadC
MFGEPAWDMLVALYVADAAGRDVSVSGLAEWSECPRTTGLRWLAFLEKEGLIRRRSHPSDRRMYFSELAEDARRALDEFFSSAPTV